MAFPSHPEEMNPLTRATRTTRRIRRRVILLGAHKVQQAQLRARVSAGEALLASHRLFTVQMLLAARCSPEQSDASALPKTMAVAAVPRQQLLGLRSRRRVGAARRETLPREPEVAERSTTNADFVSAEREVTATNDELSRGQIQNGGGAARANVAERTPQDLIQQVAACSRAKFFFVPDGARPPPPPHTRKEDFLNPAAPKFIPFSPRTGPAVLPTAEPLRWRNDPAWSGLPLQQVPPGGLRLDVGDLRGLDAGAKKDKNLEQLTVTNNKLKEECQANEKKLRRKEQRILNLEKHLKESKFKYGQLLILNRERASHQGERPPPSLAVGATTGGAHEDEALPGDERQHRADLSLALSATFAFDVFEGCVFLVVTDLLCRCVSFPWWLVPLAMAMCFVPAIALAKRILDVSVHFALEGSVCSLPPDLPGNPADSSDEPESHGGSDDLDDAFRRGRAARVRVDSFFSRISGRAVREESTPPPLAFSEWQSSFDEIRRRRREEGNERHE